VYSVARRPTLSLWSRLNLLSREMPMPVNPLAGAGAGRLVDFANSMASVAYHGTRRESGRVSRGATKSRAATLAALTAVPTFAPSLDALPKSTARAAAIRAPSVAHSSPSSTHRDTGVSVVYEVKTENKYTTQVRSVHSAA
jgi:hypothetical protein